MVTFFAIVIVLLVVNGALLFFSTNRAVDEAGELTNKEVDQKASNIHPLDLDTSKYKKAI